jgi:hypothetical protein
MISNVVGLVFFVIGASLILIGNRQRDVRSLNVPLISARGKLVLGGVFVILAIGILGNNYFPALGDMAARRMQRFQ